MSSMGHSRCGHRNIGLIGQKSCEMVSLLSLSLTSLPPFPVYPINLTLGAAAITYTKLVSENLRWLRRGGNRYIQEREDSARTIPHAHHTFMAPTTLRLYDNQCFGQYFDFVPVSVPTLSPLEWFRYRKFSLSQILVTYISIIHHCSAFVGEAWRWQGRRTCVSGICLRLDRKSCTQDIMWLLYQVWYNI